MKHRQLDKPNLTMRSKIPTRDLLFAHAVMCEYAQLCVANNKDFALRLCEVINTYQDALCSHMKKNAEDFVVTPRGLFWAVEPRTGWRKDNG